MNKDAPLSTVNNRLRPRCPVTSPMRSESPKLRPHQRFNFLSCVGFHGVAFRVPLPIDYILPTHLPNPSLPASPSPLPCSYALPSTHNSSPRVPSPSYSPPPSSCLYNSPEPSPPYSHPRSRPRPLHLPLPSSPNSFPLLSLYAYPPPYSLSLTHNSPDPPPLPIPLPSLSPPPPPATTFNSRKFVKESNAKVNMKRK